MHLRSAALAGATNVRQPGSRAAYGKSARNELELLQQIFDHTNASRIELAKRTGLSAACVGGIVQRLLKKDLIVESGENSAPLGRKPVSLSVRSDAAYFVGVDLGSYMLRVVVTDMLGNGVYRFETVSRVSEGRQTTLQLAFEAIDKAMCDCGVDKSRIKGIGMAHSGVVDRESGTILSFPRPGQMAQWRNVPLRDMLEETFSLPATIDDSTRAMAIAEKHWGIAVGLADFLYIGISMGIGASLFIDGKLYRGPGGLAGEFGHMTANRSGPLCSCGNYGCLETVASCAAIMDSVRSALAKGVDSRIPELAKGDLDHISIELIAQAATENDGLAFRILHEAASHIGIALADVVNLLNPRVVIFGGPLFRHAAAILLDPLQRIIKQHALEKSANEVQLTVSSLGSEAAALGATRLISQETLPSLYEECR
ncbi:MAG: ROK family protein [Terriglobia bacterium]